MKIIYYILVILFLQSCSFDKKSGIWKNSSEEIKKVNNNFKDFKKIVLESEIFFNKTVELDKEFIFSLTSSSFPNKWNDFFYENNNVNANFAYSDKNELIFQSSKLSRKKMNSNILLMQLDKLLLQIE